METIKRTLNFAGLENQYPVYIGYLYALICHFSFVASGSLTQKAAKHLKTYQILSATGISLAFFNYSSLYLKKMTLCSNVSRTNRWMVFRACIGPLAAVSITIGLPLLPLSEVTALTMTTPVITAILAIFLLGEKLDLMIFANSIFSFIGVIFIAKPSFLFENTNSANYEHRSTGIILVLFGSFAGGCVQIVLKKLNPMSNAFSITFHFGLVLAAVGGIGQIFQGVNDVEFIDIVYLAFVGGLSFFGLLLLTKSYGFGDAGKISLMFYTQVLFAYTIEIIIDQIIPDTYSVVGSVFIFSSVFIMMYRIHRQKQAENA